MNAGLIAALAAGALVVVGLGCRADAAPVYPVVAAQSSLTFSGLQQGERFTGAFQRFDAHIEYAPDDLAGSRFDVTVPVKSLDSKSAERDQALVTPDWFDVGRFPTATFRTVAMRSTSGGLVADADLSIKGRTRRIAFPFAWKAVGTGATLDARVTLDRLDFGLGGGEWADESAVGRKIDVVVHLTLGSPASPPPATKPDTKRPARVPAK